MTKRSSWRTISQWSCCCTQFILLFYWWIFISFNTSLSTRVNEQYMETSFWCSNELEEFSKPTLSVIIIFFFWEHTKILWALSANLFPEPHLGRHFRKRDAWTRTVILKLWTLYQQHSNTWEQHKSKFRAPFRPAN